MEIHERGHERSPWLSVAHLPAPTSFPAMPWEQCHRHELALRDGLHAIDKQQSTNEGNGNRNSKNRHHEASFQLTSIREAELVSRSLYALQGIPVAVAGIQLLAKAFSQQLADRSLHRLPSLWQRSSSSKALGKLLTTFARAGWVRCQLEEFVQFFLTPQKQKVPVFDCFHAEQNMQSQAFNSKKQCKGKKKAKNLQKSTNFQKEDLNSSPPYTLVNQAFARAVRTILQGHLTGLNALTSSVLQRRLEDSPHSFDLSYIEDNAGTVIGLPSCEITLLELHLHTNQLRLQLEALASICLCNTGMGNFELKELEDCGDWSMESSLNNLSACLIRDFKAFPKGADLLTLLYNRLQEADSVHLELLRYLFSCACQPYLAFVQSWLYSATVKDPYKEFMVEEAVDNAGPEYKKSGQEEHVPTHVQVSVSAPSFLEEICTPLLRAGQQLRILSKLIETGALEAAYTASSCGIHGFRMLESALNGWTEFAGKTSTFFPSLVFEGDKLEGLVHECRVRRHRLMRSFDLLFSNLRSHGKDSGCLELSDSVESGQMRAGSVGFELDGGTHEELRQTVQENEDRQGKEHEARWSLESSTLASALDDRGCGDDARDDKAYSDHPDQTDKKETEHVGPGIDGRLECRNMTSLALTCHSESKQRKRWTEPLDVVIVHAQSYEDACSVQKLAEEKYDVCHSMSSVLEHESKRDSFTCGSFQNNPLGLPYSHDFAAHAYDVPSFYQVSLWSELALDVGTTLRNSSLVRNQQYCGFSFFFPDACLEELGPEKFFGRSYIHKLSLAYNDPMLPPGVGGYRKNVIDFDHVSSKLWSFEDCVSVERFDMKLLPTFASSNTASAAVKQGNHYRVSVEGRNDNINSMLPSNTMATSVNQSRDVVDSKVLLAVSIEDTRMDKQEDHVASAESKQNKQEMFLGGESWQTYLGTKDHESKVYTVFTGNVLDSSDIPLEIVVDKCIIQEVLLQYECISHFTVRLLHEVFGLQDHFAALRRYFFMERGDWADSFTAALYHHAWYSAASEQRQLEVQTLLEAAIQNSSCQEDAHAERLRVCIGMDHDASQPSSQCQDHVYINKNSLSAFDFVCLGYRLEWPVSLILTTESLKLYNATFRSLVRAKLAVHALADIWQFLKDILHVTKKENAKYEEAWISKLTLFRQQSAHFITTLQGYMESQLLHSVWHKFLQVLHQEGKDIQSLELLHMMYLKDALHVCFLSDEMKPVKASVDDVMQCVLDLSTCLRVMGKSETGKPTLESEKVQSAIVGARQRYESSIQRLNQLKSNSYHQSDFSHFWSRLNFNGFLGDVGPNIPR